MIQRFIHAEGTVPYKQENSVWINNSLKEYGIKFRLQTIQLPFYTSPRISCIINFKKVIEPGNKIGILTVWEVDAVEQRFNELIRPLGLPRFKYWKVHRIDYSINVRTSYVEDYLKLMEKGDRPRLRDWYDKKNRNYCQKSGESLYLVSTAKRKNRSCTVNFYNKQNERYHTIVLDGEEDNPELDEVMELSKDILRLEIQCLKPKTESIKEKYGFKNKSIINYLDPKICEDIIGTFIKRISGNADYHTKEVAFNIIDRSKCHIENKEKMKDIIQGVAVQHSSIAKVREKFAEECIMEIDEYNKLVKRMYEMNVNPVTIGDKLIRKYGKAIKEGLPSVDKIFKSALEEELVLNIEEK